MFALSSGQMPRKTQRGIGAVMAAVLVVVMLAGYGISSSAAAATPSKPLTHVTLQLLWLPQTQFAGYYVALDKGFYRSAGLDVSINPGGPNLTPASLVASGAATFGDGLGPLDVEIGQSKGLGLVEVATLSQTDYQRLASLKSLHITRPRQLDGKTVGYFVGPGLYEMKAMIQKDGGNPNSVHWVVQGTNLAPITSGEWGAGSATVFNELLTLREKHVKVNIFDPNKYGVGIPYSGIATTESVLAKQPKLVQAFVTASLRGWEWAFRHPAATVAIVMHHGIGLTAPHQLAQLKQMQTLLCSGRGQSKGMGYVSALAMRNGAKFLRHYHLANVPNRIGSMYTNRFVNRTPKAYRSCAGL